MLLHSLYPGRPKEKKKPMLKGDVRGTELSHEPVGLQPQVWGDRPQPLPPPGAASLACDPLKLSTHCCPINQVDKQGFAASLLVKKPPGLRPSSSHPGWWQGGCSVPGG